LNNEPAFPTISTPGNKDGMTLLDYFAGKALQSLVIRGVGRDAVVVCAYNITEEMMEERKRRGEQK
jgi:hypothetical protein